MMNNTSRHYQFTFDEDQLRTIVEGLHELRGKLCVPVLNSIQDQIRRQDNGNEYSENSEKKNGKVVRHTLSSVKTSLK